MRGGGGPRRHTRGHGTVHTRGRRGTHGRAHAVGVWCIGVEILCGVCVCVWNTYEDMMCGVMGVCVCVEHV